jgi:hypothetical protein
VVCTSEGTEAPVAGRVGDGARAEDEWGFTGPVTVTVCVAAAEERTVAGVEDAGSVDRKSAVTWATAVRTESQMNSPAERATWSKAASTDVTSEAVVAAVAVAVVRRPRKKIDAIMVVWLCGFGRGRGH